MDRNMKLMAIQYMIRGIADSKVITAISLCLI